MTLNFKNRIAFFNTLSAAVTALLIFVSIYAVVHDTSYRHLDADIELEKEEVISNLDWTGDSIIINKMPEWEEAEHNQIEVNPTFIQIVNRNGEVVFHSSNLKTDQFLFNPKLEGETFYNGVISDQHIRFGQFALKNQTGKVIGQLTIAISRQESFKILGNLFLVLLIAFPLLLAVQILASRFAASKAIFPVYQLIKTASGIDHSNISTRLKLPARKDEIYRIAQTVNDLLNRIESGIQQQKQFTSDVSHEIRTPLSAIRGTLDVLIRKKREAGYYEDKIREVIQQADRLDFLLDELLQLARLESGVTVIKKVPVPLADVVSSLKEKYIKGDSPNKPEINLDIPKGTTVIADRFYLEMILDNLISNAVKYGKEKGTIDLRWNRQDQTLSISDDGIGISEENLAHIFNLFYRADASRSSEIEGSGLGLSIVKKLADLQQINISVASKVGEGTTFTLRF